MNKLYFYGVLYGIGIISFVGSIVVGTLYYASKNYHEIIGCYMCFILSIFLLNKFTEKKALENETN